jgi:hypothetical protein
MKNAMRIAGFVYIRTLAWKVPKPSSTAVGMARISHGLVYPGWIRVFLRVAGTSDVRDPDNEYRRSMLWRATKRGLMGRLNETHKVIPEKNEANIRRNVPRAVPANKMVGIVAKYPQHRSGNANWSKEKMLES